MPLSLTSGAKCLLGSAASSLIQAVRLADLAAARLAYAEGRARPAADAIDVPELVGNVMAEFGDSDGDTDSG